MTDVHASGMPFRTAGEPSTGFVEAVARLEGGRVLLVGDFMLDETVRGAAERLSPDAPVPVLAVDGEDGFERRPGGAGNVAACLRGVMERHQGVDAVQSHARWALKMVEKRA